MDFWLDLFTGTTWDEFQRAGARISGFRERMRSTVSRIKPGDILLCYMTGVMRWVGAIEVVGPSEDTSDIWSLADFPERLEVKPIVLLSPEHGVPMEQLVGKVRFYEGPNDRGKFKGFVRRSPNLFKRQDGEVVLDLLKQAEEKPVHRPVDPAKLARIPLFKAEKRKGKQAVQTLVSIPETEENHERAVEKVEPEPAGEASDHTRLQHILLTLGQEMGFQIWIARNDRGKMCDGVALGQLPGIVESLPTQFNEATNRTIELIDVLWLKGNSIVAAFEIECTTVIYSGLLRMSDLLALQPDLKISLYIVAPGERKSKVRQEILRPTFTIRNPPLAEICGFISAEELSEKIDGLRELQVIGSLKPDYLEQLADYFTEEE